MHEYIDPVQSPFVRLLYTVFELATVSSVSINYFSLLFFEDSRLDTVYPMEIWGTRYPIGFFVIAMLSVIASGNSR